MNQDRPLGPDSRDREARMRSLVDAALDLFATDGYANVSTRRIADRAGCSETLLFRYFGGKRGLLVAITDNFTDVDADRPPVTGELGVAELIERHILVLCETMQSRARETRVLVAQLTDDPGLSGDFEKRHEIAVGRLQAELARQQRLGAIRSDVDVRAVAVGVEGLAFSLAFVEEIIYRRGREHSAAVARVFATSLADGMRPAAPGPPAGSGRDAAAVRGAIDALRDALAILTADDRRT